MKNDRYHHCCLFINVMTITVLNHHLQPQALSNYCLQVSFCFLKQKLFSIQVIFAFNWIFSSLSLFTLTTFLGEDTRCAYSRSCSSGLVASRWRQKMQACEVLSTPGKKWEHKKLEILSHLQTWGRRPWWRSSSCRSPPPPTGAPGCSSSYHHHFFGKKTIITWHNWQWFGRMECSCLTNTYEEPPVYNCPSREKTLRVDGRILGSWLTEQPLQTKKT